MNSHLNAIILSITTTMLMAIIFILLNSQANANNYYDEFSRNTDLKLQEIEYLGDYENLKANDNTAVIFPIFTQSAYEWGGIFDYYSGRCDDCKTAKILNFYDKLYSNSGNGFRVLEILDYHILDDIDVDKNPEILKNFDTIILLHNEYVTKNEYNAIISHPNVVYLYPNALSSEVDADYTTNTITLVRGPGYPDENITNGFNWKYDNSEFLNNWECNNWQFYEIDNGFMLNCYPDKLLNSPNGRYLLESLKSF